MPTTQKYKENIHKCHHQDKEYHQSTKITKLSKSYHSNKDGNAKNVHNCTSVWKFCTQGYYSIKIFQIFSLHSVSNTHPVDWPKLVKWISNAGNSNQPQQFHIV